MSQAGLASTNGMPTPTTYVTNAGNAVPVPMIKCVIKEMLNAQAKIKRL